MVDMIDAIVVREAGPTDAEEVIRLFTQLGHPQPDESASSRLAAAEKYFAGRGCVMVELTSNKKRLDAHRFYEQLGYIGTSFRFAKQLPVENKES